MVSFTIPNIYFVIAIGILTLFLTFYTTKGGLTDSRPKSILEKLTKRGKIVTALLIMMILVLTFQEKNAKNIINNNDLALKKEQHERDSIITSRIDSSNKKIFSDLSISFLKLGFRPDNLVNQKNVINYYVSNDIDPVLSVNSTDGIHLVNNSFYSVEIESKGASAANFNIESKLLIEMKNGSIVFEKLWTLDKDFPPITNKIIAPLTIKNEDIEVLYLHLKGTYSNLSLTKTYNFDQLFCHDTKTGQTLGKIGKEKELIINQMNLLEKINNH